MTTMTTIETRYDKLYPIQQEAVTWALKLFHRKYSRVELCPIECEHYRELIELNRKTLKLWYSKNGLLTASIRQELIYANDELIWVINNLYRKDEFNLSEHLRILHSKLSDWLDSLPCKF